MKNLLLCILVASLFSSCYREPIDLDLNEGDPTFIIGAWLSESPDHQFVSTSISSNYLGKLTIDYVEGAVVTLSDQDKSYLLEERVKGKHFLPQYWKLTSDQEYKLEVMFNDKIYTAEHESRSVPEIIEIGFRDGSEDWESIQYYETTISFLDNAGEGDGYFYRAFNKNNSVKDKINRGFLRDDKFIDGILFEDVVATDYEYRHQSGDTIVVELYSIGKEALDYFNDILSESFRSEDPFASPPVNARSNISGGAAGYFLVSDMVQREVIIN